MTENNHSFPNISNSEPKLSELQKNLLSQLKSISELLPKIYLDILELHNTTLLKTRVNLVAHLMRELDSAIREELLGLLGLEEERSLPENEIKRAYDKIKKRFNEQKIKNNLRSKTMRELGDSLKRELDSAITDFIPNFKEKSGYKENICRILDNPQQRKLREEWISVGSQLPKLAHRKGIDDVRPFELISELWGRYENILFQVIGSSLIYHILNFLDRYLKKERPPQSKKEMHRLKKWLKNTVRQEYFFSRLRHIKWLQHLNEAGFFDPKNSPKPKPAENGEGYYTLLWEPLIYLEWVSANLQSDDYGVVEELMKIIDRIIEFRDQNKKRIKNYRNDFSIFKILNNIPSDCISPKHIEFIKQSLETDRSSLIRSQLAGGDFIKKLISEENKQLLVKLIDLVCSYVEVDKEKINFKYLEFHPLIEGYWFDKLIKENKNQIAKYASKEVAEVVIGKIEEIEGKKPNNFNALKIPRIGYNVQQRFIGEYERLLIDLLAECLLNFEEEELIDKTSQLLKNQLEVLKRVGLFLVNKKFDLLSRLFFDLDFNPLDGILEYESCPLLKNNVKKFSNDQIEKVISWIENMNFDYLDRIRSDSKETPSSILDMVFSIEKLTPEKKKQSIAYNKKRIYYALLSSNNPEIRKKYKEYNEINPSEIEDLGVPYKRAVSAGEKAPLDEFEIEKSSVKRLVSRMKEFKEKEFFDGQTVRGFSDMIKSDVEKKPSKYSDSLELFKDRDIDYAYLCGLVNGFIKASMKETKIDWDKILNFINIYIDEDFWSSGQTKKSDDKSVITRAYGSSAVYFNKEQLVREMAELVKEFLREKSVNRDMLPVAKKILLKLTCHEFSYQIGQGYLDLALNSTEGKILEAMVHYSLMHYKLAEKKWDEDIKGYFTRRIEDKKYIETHTIVGRYLRWFKILDSKWVESKFEEIFPLNEDDILSASFSGLLYQMSCEKNINLYKDIYVELKEKRIYQKILDLWEKTTEGLANDLCEQLWQFVCISYAEKWEEFVDGSLIKQLLVNPQTLNSVINYIQYMAGDSEQKYKERIKILWKFIFENNRNSKITGKLMLWLDIFDELDDELSAMCLEGAEFVERQGVHYVIQCLTKFTKSNCKQAGEILLKIVDNVVILSDYRKEDVIKIVEDLYKNKEKDLADLICNKYFKEQGFDFLREIGEKNQRQQ